MEASCHEATTHMRITILIFLLTAPFYLAAAQHLQTISGTSTILSHDVAVDEAGNAYITGGFVGNALFEDLLLTSIGLKDIFVAKYDANGRFLWHFSIGGTLGGPGLDDEGLAISVSDEGHIYVAGYFQGEADFDPGFETVTLTSAGFRDAFIASYTTNGELRWAKRFGGPADDLAFGVNADDDFAVYFTGLFRDEAMLEPNGEATFASHGEEDGFVVSLNHDGAHNWTIPFGGSSVDAGRDVGVDDSGNLYLLGHFSGRVEFALNSTAGVLTSLNSSQDAVLASYTSDGSFRWAFPLGGPQADDGLGLAVDPAGNSYITGHFVGRMDFDPDDFNDFYLTSVGARDLYVARYTSTGLFSWAKQAGSGFAQGEDVDVSNSGRLAVTGFFSGTIFPDPGSTFSLTSQDEQDIVLASYQSDGTFLWAGGIGGSFTEHGSGAAFNPKGQVFLTGYFETETDFDPGPTEQFRTSSGELDGFVALYNSDGALAVSIDEPVSLSTPFLEIYPNPVQGRAHIAMELYDTDILQLEMVDVLGRKIHVIDRINGLIGRKATVSLDLADVPAGVYFVRVRGTNLVESRSFVVTQ